MSQNLLICHQKRLFLDVLGLLGHLHVNPLVSFSRLISASFLTSTRAFGQRHLQMLESIRKTHVQKRLCFFQVSDSKKKTEQVHLLSSYHLYATPQKLFLSPQLHLPFSMSRTDGNCIPTAKVLGRNSNPKASQR